MVKNCFCFIGNRCLFVLLHRKLRVTCFIYSLIILLSFRCKLSRMEIKDLIELGMKFDFTVVVDLVSIHFCASSIVQ